MTNVYFVKSRQYVKIGKADDVPARIAQLQTGNPEPLVLLGTISEAPDALEGQLHAAFMEYHHSGEWFQLGRTLRKVVLLIAKGAQPKTPKDIEILKQFSPQNGFALGNDLEFDCEQGLGGLAKSNPKRVGLRSRVA